MRTLPIVASVFALCLTLSACFKAVEIPFATDPRIMRGAWSGQMDATCIGADTNAQVNADNSRLVSSGAQAAIWNFATGAKIAPLEQNASEFLSQVGWGSDGRVIGVVSVELLAWVRRWRADDGKLLSASRLPSNIFFSRDGSRYAYTVYDKARPQGTLKVFDITGSVLSSIPLGNEESPLKFSDDGSALFTRERIYAPNTLTETISIRSAASGAVLQNVDTSKLNIGHWAVRGSTIWGYGNDQLTSIDPSGAVITQAFKINQGQARGILGFSLSPNTQQLAVRTYTDARVYNLSDLETPIKTITDTGLSSNLEWSADGTHLVLAFAEPRTPVLNPSDSRLQLIGRFGVRCGWSARSLSAAPDVEFIESERESQTVSMQLEATYVSERSYAISGTATIGAMVYTVTGEGYAEYGERLLTAPIPRGGQQIALTLRDAAGLESWKTSYRSIALPERGLDISPLNALGLLERVGDGKQFLIDLERR